MLVFDPSLQRSRVKDPGESYQRLMWLLGSVTALVRKLSEWLNTEALRFELIFSAEGDEGALLEEEGVLSLLLREYRERGQVDVRRVDSTLGAVREAREQHRGRARVMLFFTKLPSGLEGEAAPDALIDVAGTRPRVHWADANHELEDASATAAEAWSAVTKQLLDGLLKRR